MGKDEGGRKFQMLQVFSKAFPNAPPCPLVPCKGEGLKAASPSPGKASFLSSL